MNRRGFLGLLAGAMVLDPERLLWRPGAKLIDIPRKAPLWDLDGQRVFPVYTRAGGPPIEYATYHIPDRWSGKFSDLIERRHPLAEWSRLIHLAA